MQSFNSLILDIRKHFDDSLKKIQINDKPKYLYDPIRYSIQTKGKRFRPVLLHLVGRANNVQPDILMTMSLAIELLHNFTLIHDDIMDNDNMRRGKKTIHEKWDLSTAILSGDGIYTISQIILSQIPNLKSNVFSYFNKTTLEICEGQALDKEFENNYTISEDMYISMIEKKTGALIGASSALPLIFKHKPQHIVKVYEKLGRCIGKAFQIQDDILEITGDYIKMGKSLGSDILLGKQTIMAIKANNKYPSEWEDLISNSGKKNLTNNISKFLNDKGIIEECKLEYKAYFSASLEYLNQLEDIDISELVQLVNMLEKRTF